MDCNELYSKDHEQEEREASIKDESTPASLCFGSWCEDSNESETIRSVTVVDMTDGSFWESPVSHLDNGTLREHLTRTVSDHLNRPLSPNPKNSDGFWPTISWFAVSCREATKQ